MASGGSARDNSGSSSISDFPVSGMTLKNLSLSTEIDYCIRTINFLISTLKLQMPQLRNLEQLTMDVLIQIYCALMGISFSTEFIPSAHPREDVERMILSLKDKFGSDQFGALEAKKIANKNPTQIRFLLENFHLILNHQLDRARKASKSKSSNVVTSRSGNHLSVWTPSSSNIKQDSFYVLPHQLDVGESFDTNSTNPDITDGDENETDDSFQTVENVVVNVYEESTSDESTRDPLFTSGVNPDVSRKVTRSQNIREQLPLTSSPIIEDKERLSRNHQSPNISSIRPSRSALSNLQQTTDSKSMKRSIPQRRSQSLQSDRARATKDLKSQPTMKKDIVNVLAKNDKFGKSPFSSSNLNKGRKQEQRKQPEINQTQYLSESESSQSDEMLAKVRDMHANIRSQISESLINMDKDISKLKRKPSKPKVSQAAVCSRKPLPNLRWLMPVEARFPEYRKGVIIPKCTSWRTNLKNKTTKPCPSAFKSEGFRGNSETYSTLAQRGSNVDRELDELQELISLTE